MAAPQVVLTALEDLERAGCSVASPLKGDPYFIFGEIISIRCMLSERIAVEILIEKCNKNALVHLSSS